MGFEFWGEGILFIFIFLIIVGIPCVGVAILGYRMICELGYFPSKTPAIQTGVFFKLIILEIISFLFIIIFYHLFSSA